MKRTVLVIGASRGIGAAVARHYCVDDDVISVSRSESEWGKWVKADISTQHGIEQVIEAVGDRAIDALLFMGGVWEKNAFTSVYDFRKSSFEETQFVINVNLVAPIEITKGLVDNLKKAANPRAVYMGALSGLENSNSREVAYSASKFGLRGAVQALRRELESEGIGFTTVNPGLVATEEVLEDISQGAAPAQPPIPLEDVMATVDWLLSLSTSADVGEVDLRQKN